MRIRTYLVLVGAAVLLPAFLAAGFGVHKVREGQREAALRGLHETVRATALLVDGEVQRSLGALTALGNSAHLGTGNLAAFYEQARAVDQPPNVWTLLFDETGTQLLNTAVPFGTPAPPPTAKERVAQVLATQRLLVTDIIRGPVTGKLITTLYLPARSTLEGRRFVVAQAFAVDHWNGHLLQPASRATWRVAIIDKQGRFIWRSHDAARLVGAPARPELVAAAAAGREGLIRHHTLDGLDVHDAFAHSALTGWTVAVAAPAESVDAAAWQGVAWFTAGVASALGLALAAALFLGGFLVKAIGLASEAARQVGEGKLPQLPTTSVDELNTLNDALRGSSQLIARGQGALNNALADRDKLLQNETAAREEAQRQNVAKDKFLALLGHELRNPLAAIYGAAEVLLRNQPLDPRSERFLKIIQRQNGHLSRIVNDLLDVSRMLSGKLVLQISRFDLAACVEHCISGLRTSQVYPGRHLIVDASEVWVQGDPVRLEQIVSNLVTNAMKFSDPGDDIRVVVRAEGTNAVIEVTDEGSGIEPDFIAHVFEPFVQGKPREGHLAAGLGIGLALVKQLVELHGGGVQARSAGVGQGASFVVVLPSCPSSREDTAGNVPALIHGKRVLLVEDNGDAMESTAELLRTLGLQVVTAATGEQGLLEAHRVGPDLILLDIGLPERSGYDIARLMRASARLADLPIVALTGYGQASDKEKAREAGFSAHLTKPVNVDELSHLLARYLS